MFALVTMVLLCSPARAAINPIPQPDASYQARTTKINIVDPDFTDLTSITDGTLTITFSAIREVHTVPGGGWSTWSSPPNSESSTPRVLTADNYDPSATTLTLSFSQPLLTFGVEAEPDPFSVHTITADFYNGATLVGSISLGVDGNAGARLFAADATGGTQFTSVVFTSDADFALAQFRYSLVPEPSTWAIFIVGAVMMVGIRLRRQWGS